MIYADYEYYKNEYRGNVVKNEDDFLRLAPRASAWLDRLTYGRSKDHADEEPVKMACCAVSEVMLRQESANGQEIIAEANDGVSVSYASSGKSADRTLYDAAALYLMSTGMMYRGCNR